jgi:hypothetical protein
MPKEVILYNLADNVTDEQYAEYVNEEKGPFLVQLPAAKSFTLVRIIDSMKGKIPYNYVGVLDYTSMEEWEKDISSEAFGKFMQTWSQKVSPDFHVLQGVEVYYGEK